MKETVFGRQERIKKTDREAGGFIYHCIFFCVISSFISFCL